jgi:hypothetical protein
MPAPSKPAPASGPGALSRRTDTGPAQKLMQLPDAKYGEQATYQQDQRGAPLAQTPTPSAQPAQFAPNPAAQSVVPFSAPTQRPSEPVTNGAALGAGAGPEALGIAPQQILRGDADKLARYLPVLEFAANAPDSLPGARLFVNTLKANMSAGSPTNGPAANPIPTPTPTVGGPTPQ